MEIAEATTSPDLRGKICGCGDSHCETCNPQENEPSGYCRPGAFYCPYRGDLTVCIDKDFCKGCKYSYTNREWRDRTHEIRREVNEICGS